VMKCGSAKKRKRLKRFRLKAEGADTAVRE
jgi:hypothetical protein